MKSQKYVKCTGCGKKLLKSKERSVCDNCINLAVEKVMKKRTINRMLQNPYSLEDAYKNNLKRSDNPYNCGMELNK